MNNLNNSIKIYSKLFKIKGFTFVELIIVITLLVILGTIGFLSYSSYTVGVRDTNRISQLTNLKNTLNMYSFDKILPLPEESVQIKNGTEIIAYQGYLGKNIIESIGYSTQGLDPKDKQYYSYYLTGDRRYFQLLGFLEESKSLGELNLINKANANINRYVYTDGSRLGILTDLNNVPIQEIETIKSMGEFDILNVGSLELKSFLSYNEYVRGNGSIFLNLKNISKVGGKDWLVENNEFIYGGEEVYRGSTPIGNTGTNSCNTQPNYVNASFTIGTPTTQNQIWQNTNNENPCYYECINGYTGNDCSIAPVSPLITCPTGYILVPGNPTFNTNDFCVAKYEMKNVGGVATSQSAGTPWSSISQINAITACNALGTGYHLITNNEWMTIARNIETNSQNWANGVVGSLVSEAGGLYRGNVNLNDSASCGNNTVLDGDIAGTNCLVGARNKRMHILSNGNEIWDMGGNLSELVNGTNNISSINGEVSGVVCSGGVNKRYSWSSINDGASPCTFTNASPNFYSKANHGPAGNYNNDNGVGRIFSYNYDNRVFRRGGSWDMLNIVGGIYTLNLMNSSSASAFSTVGFRCAFSVN